MSSEGQIYRFAPIQLLSIGMACIIHAVDDCTVLVLAGGKSTRMGRDKAFVEFDGRTLLSRALELAGSVSEDVCIVGSRQTFAGLGTTLEDVHKDCGPLGGIHAALILRCLN